MGLPFFTVRQPESGGILAVRRTAIPRTAALQMPQKERNVRRPRVSQNRGDSRYNPRLELSE